MRVLRRLIALGILLVGLSLVGTVAFIYTFTPSEDLPQGATVVVLSGPGGSAPTTAGETLLRTDTGVRIFRNTKAALLIMTGDGRPPGDNAHAINMKARAMGLGVPEGSIAVEPNSFSTLQNAWYTRSLTDLDPTQPTILVTHRYHLPRAWASFRWAGFTELTLVAADAGPPEVSQWLVLEGIKWPLNILRAAGASIALAAGAPEEAVLPWLK